MTDFRGTYSQILLFLPLTKGRILTADKLFFIMMSSQYDRRNTHTYIISRYIPSVRIIDLVSQTTYVVCVNFIHKWRNLQFKVDSERPIVWETIHGNFIYSQSFCQKYAERNSPKKYFSSAGSSYNEPTHNLLNHGDLRILLCN